jgi:predicted HTH transcriptional regulator
MKRNTQIGRMWTEMEKLRQAHSLHERIEAVLMDAAFNYNVRNARYREESKISDVVASRDLKRLCDLGLLMPVGEKRGRYYVAAEPLKEIRASCTDKTRAGNPYDIARSQVSSGQLSLPGV